MHIFNVFFLALSLLGSVEMAPTSENFLAKRRIDDLPTQDVVCRGFSPRSRMTLWANAPEQFLTAF
jgi:hypothetical protein